MEERLIEIFKEYLPAWSWEEWQAAGASDKEDIVINALADLGPDMTIEVDEAYDLFWDWAAGITEADFGRKITESTAEDPYGYGPYKVPTDPKLEVGDYIKAKRYSSDTTWYPARVTRITPDFVDYTISGFGFIKNGLYFSVPSNKSFSASTTNSTPLFLRRSSIISYVFCGSDFGTLPDNTKKFPLFKLSNFL
jgi:hypothetical protein